MIIRPTALDGVLVIEAEPIIDERGAFVEWFDVESLRAHGFEMQVTNAALSTNIRRHTLRGLHYQADPHGQPKLVRCTRGEVFDVIIDVRRASPTYGASETARLRGDDHLVVAIPTGCAHGFLTLADDSEISYLLDGPRIPDAERGIRWDDPSLEIPWPASPAIISARDQSFAPFALTDAPAAEH